MLGWWLEESKNSVLKIYKEFKFNVIEKIQRKMASKKP
jgi:hypothetical protein